MEGRGVPDPVFILAPHRSFTSVICAMLGQHPQMYGLPETNLFCADTLGDWWDLYEQGRALNAHGLLRAVAQLFFEEQTVTTVRLARSWLWRRLHWDTGSVFACLQERKDPAVMVDKSPITVHSPDHLSRLIRYFPRARFIHLLRHPVEYSESLMALPLGRLWAIQHGAINRISCPPAVDPQLLWQTVHTNICNFLSRVPKEQKLRIRGEDLLANPDLYLRKIAAWLSLSTKREAVQRMKHPEESPFACFGPSGSTLGNDPSFLEDPRLRPYRKREVDRHGRLRCGQGGNALSPQVKSLAKDLGYE